MYRALCRNVYGPECGPKNMHKVCIAAVALHVASIPFSLEGAKNGPNRSQANRQSHKNRFT